MKIEINENQLCLLKNALDYVVLSLDGNKVDNSKLNNNQKLQVLADCYYIREALDHAGIDYKNKEDKASELDSDSGRGIHLSPEQQKEMKKQYDELMSKQVLRMEPPKLDLHFPWDYK